VDDVEQIVVYSSPGCAYCVRATALLHRERLPFTEVTLDDPHLDLRAELELLTGGRTFPQVVIDGTTIGGYTELAELLRGRAKLAA
jgi:glutaredoxin 3